MLDYDSFEYFADFGAITIVLLPAFYATRRASVRSVLLGISGIYLLALIAPRLALFYLLFWLGIFALQYVARLGTERRLGSMWMVGCVGAVLAPMVLWKVFPEWFIVGFNARLNRAVVDIAPWVGAVDRVRDIILPIGLSFATFRAIDVLIKIRLGLLDPLSPAKMFGFGFFPPVQIIGPVIEYSEVSRGFDTPARYDPRDFLSGVVLGGIGLAKVFVAAYALQASGTVLAFEATSGGWWEYWVELLVFGLYFYVNFSGFSDMAIGMARLFGFTLKPNFQNPYGKTNPQDFWNSWHMSLTRFCQRNVFVPLGGMRRETQYVAILATIMVIALWHDISISLVIFGIYHGTGLVTHRWWSERRSAPRPEGTRRWALAGVHYVYFVLSLPLLLLPYTDLPHFYARLVPG